MPGNANYRMFDAEPSKQTALQFAKFHNLIASRHSHVGYLQSSSVVNSMLRTEFEDRQRQFTTADGQKWIGHVVARVSPTLTDENDKPIGMLGFFAAKNDTGTIVALLNAATEWLREKGCDTIVGPIDGDTWHSYRLNVGPFDEPSFLSEPSNPEYYSQLWIAAGFQVIDRYHSKVVDNITDVLPVVADAFDQATSQGYYFRPLELNQFEAELDIIFDLSTTVFKDNFLYDEISRDEFKSLYQNAKPLLDPELVWFALAPETRKEIGFLFCIVDYGPAVAAMKGQQNLWAKIKFALKRRSATAVNFKSVGVLPEHRRSSVAAALMYKGYEESVAKGFRRANLCLIRDGNPSTKLDGGNSRILRRYELYGI